MNTKTLAEEVRIIVEPGGVVPTRATTGSNAFDLSLPKDYWMQKLPPGNTTTIDLRLRIWIDNPNIAAVIIPRSGLGTRGLVVSNLLGLIDSDYQGPLMLGVWNRTQNKMFSLEPEHRIAQLLFVQTPTVVWKEVKTFEQTTARSKGGLGSTGTESSESKSVFRRKAVQTRKPKGQSPPAGKVPPDPTPE